MRRAGVTLLLALALTTAVTWSSPAPASASAGGVICTLTGLVSGALGKVCKVATHAGKVIGAGKKLLGGHLGGALSELTGSGVARTATAAVGLVALATAVATGARYLLQETAKVIGATTRPNLTSTWFSASYWRMAAISVLLTLPFLFGAAVQAVLRSDLGLLARAAFGYLPLAMLAIGIAAPLTMLLLAASDEMSALVASASGHAGANFLGRAGGLAVLVSPLGPTVFVSFFVALLTAAATIALWVELIVRDAAVYVVVLMLPLFFAAMVWPARRIWAVRVVELLVALILSKFVIVAVLTLGGAALGHAPLPGPASVLTGATLVMLAAFSPWAVMRLLPLQELAGAAAAGLSPTRDVLSSVQRADATADAAEPVGAVQPRLSPATESDGATPDPGAVAQLPPGGGGGASETAAAPMAARGPGGTAGDPGAAGRPDPPVTAETPGTAGTAGTAGTTGTTGTTGTADFGDPTDDLISAAGAPDPRGPVPAIFRPANTSPGSNPTVWDLTQPDTPLPDLTQPDTPLPDAPLPDTPLPHAPLPDAPLPGTEPEPDPPDEALP